MFKKIRPRTSSAGFTLLEMLVVIGIIAVLIGFGAVSYSTAQKKARDAKRKTDLKAIQSALEQYYSTCQDSRFSYPGSIAGGITCTTPAITFLSSADMPKDPKSNSSYTYSLAAGVYTLCAPNSPPLETESVASYCVTGQQ